MVSETVLIAVVALAASAALTMLVRKFALSHGLLDVPNHRSSHQVSTARGGGVAIVLVSTAAWALLALLGTMQWAELAALGAGGLVVAGVGFLDDRRPVQPGVRLAVHLGAALWALLWLRGVPAVRIGTQWVDFGLCGYLVGAVAIVWTLNLFNFMDGIDGIAGSEATFVACAGSVLALIAQQSAAVPAAGLVLGAASGGFLLLNWPPARIFMGDVGSGYLGYVIAVLAVISARDNPVALLVWLILGGVFFVDATVTFLRRLFRRERVYEAHRSHAYQRLASRWGSHRRVTGAVIIVNLAWLLPCAFVATRHPYWAAWITVAALAPLFVVAILVGAGRSEVKTR